MLAAVGDDQRGSFGTHRRQRDQFGRRGRVERYGCRFRQREFQHRRRLHCTRHNAEFLQRPGPQPLANGGNRALQQGLTVAADEWNAVLTGGVPRTIMKSLSSPAKAQAQAPRDAAGAWAGICLYDT
mgnify:CR=1 FL=1